MVEIARLVSADFPDDDALRAAVEQLGKGKLLSEITRRHVAEALDAIELGGKRELLDLLRNHWPSIDQKTSYRRPLETLADDIVQHVVHNDDLPALYATAAEQLNLAPSLHSEKVFKSILGNCQSVVGNLAGLRNKLGDSHGQGKRHVKPLARHAELAVNLAGSMATFLVATWNARSS